MKQYLWKLFYSQWPSIKAPLKEGYTALLLIPADLPVFFEIALSVCSKQNLSHCREILVIPDQRSEHFQKLFHRYQSTWTGPALRLTQLNPVESFLTKKFNNPHMNCWLQLVRGVGATKTTHALWHDADLFMRSPDFLKRHYELCAESQASCMGVSPAWDAWFASKGYDYINATWELMMNVDWVRKWAPWQHRGQWRQFADENHEFDILFWAQCHTDPSSIKRHEGDHDFVHFNYVIATYRWFQRNLRSQGGPFEDNRFLLLLVRLLINAFDTSGAEYEVPSVEGLRRGLVDDSAMVTFQTEKARENYPEFRVKMNQLLNSGFVPENKLQEINRALMPFDRHFGYDIVSEMPSQPELELVAV